MSKWDVILLAFKNFLRRKARSVLTISGVIIGTASIMIMVSISLALNESIIQQASQWGSLTTIQVYRSYGGGTDLKLDDQKVLDFEKLSNVVAVTPRINAYVRLVSGKYVADVSVVGIRASMMQHFDYKLASGALLSENNAPAIVMGAQTPYFFFDPKKTDYFNGGWGDTENQELLVDVMNDAMKLTFDTSYGRRPTFVADDDGTTRKKPTLYNMTVTGLLAKSNDSDYQIYMDIDYLKKIQKEYDKQSGNNGGGGGGGIVIGRGISVSAVGGGSGSGQDNGYDQVLVKVASLEDVLKVQEEIRAMGFEANSNMEFVQQRQQETALLRMILGGIGGVALLVAALGITNTMVMSIYERTREIGIMKVLGCLLGDIRSLFLIEAAIIGFFGGCFGVGLSYGASMLLNKLAGSNMLGSLGGGSMYDGTTLAISIIPPWLALASLVFATLIGVLSGAYPAFRATRLSALEAIKNE